MLKRAAHNFRELGTVKVASIKKRWTGMRTEELLDRRGMQNAKNRIPDLKNEAFDICHIKVLGFSVLKLIHKRRAAR